MQKKESNLWRAYDENGTLLFTKVPNCLLETLNKGGWGLSHYKIISYICRLTYGFRRENTCQLGLADFSVSLHMAKSHVSKAIKSLLDNGLILRHSKNGNKYVYAINLLPEGVKMKHYRMGKPDNENDNAVYVNEHLDYELSNYTDSEKDVILYSKTGYSKSGNVYRKEDRKLDIKVDNRIDGINSTTGVGGAPPSSPSVKLPASRLVTDGTKSTTGNNTPSGRPFLKSAEARLIAQRNEELGKEFINELKQNYSVATVLKHMKKFDRGELTFSDIGTPYYQYCSDNNIRLRLDFKDDLYNEAADIYYDKYKRPFEKEVNV